MNNNIKIVIDARSGDVAVKSMIKNIIPNLSDSGKNRALQRWIDARKLAARKRRKKAHPQREVDRERHETAAAVKAAAKKKAREGDLSFGTFNVRTLAYSGRNPIGHNVMTVMQICSATGCDVIGLQETRRAGQGSIAHDGYVIIWSGARAGTKDKRGVHGVGIAIKEAMWESVGEEGRTVECISPRLMKALNRRVEYKPELFKVKESSVRDALASIVGGETEKETPVGFIDVLSDTEVIEVKYYKQWRGALGQVLAYQAYYPGLAKRVHLFAQTGKKDTEKYVESTKSVCDTHAVKVTFEECVVEVQSLDLDKDDINTVFGDEIKTQHRDKRARVKNDSDQLAGWGVRKRLAVEVDEPSWFEHASVDLKRAYASMEVRKMIAFGEIDILKSCKEELESIGCFGELDRHEFADGIRRIQRRHASSVALLL
ncbi:unnamed protein product [Ectocarpus sp. CCAP 1310/34]|nr:unnamed protein product [Ectocarpus sp. CCAP 1310/34]